mgnify:CR=1 FL=1
MNTIVTTLLVFYSYAYTEVPASVMSGSGKMYAEVRHEKGQDPTESEIQEAIQKRLELKQRENPDLSRVNLLRYTVK